MFRHVCVCVCLRGLLRCLRALEGKARGCYLKWLSREPQIVIPMVIAAKDSQYGVNKFVQHAQPGAAHWLRFARWRPTRVCPQPVQRSAIVAGDALACVEVDGELFPPPFTVYYDSGPASLMYATTVSTELALAAALICAPKGIGVFAHDCEGHGIMEWAAGEACVGDEYVPEYAIAKDALRVLWADMAVALYHKYAAV